MTENETIAIVWNKATVFLRDDYKRIEWSENYGKCEMTENKAIAILWNKATVFLRDDYEGIEWSENYGKSE